MTPRVSKTLGADWHNAGPPQGWSGPPTKEIRSNWGRVRTRPSRQEVQDNHASSLPPREVRTRHVSGPDRRQGRSAAAEATCGRTPPEWRSGQSHAQAPVRGGPVAPRVRWPAGSLRLEACPPTAFNAGRRTCSAAAERAPVLTPPTAL